MNKTIVKRGLLEFPSHGNRIWHRCQKLYDAWIEALSKRHPDVVANAGRYGIMWNDMLRRKTPSLSPYTDLSGYLSQRELLSFSLVPMYRIGGHQSGEPECLDADNNTYPGYLCPACLKIFDEREVESGRTVKFGESGKPDSRKRYGYD
jgi:hypothetical protein